MYTIEECLEKISTCLNQVKLYFPIIVAKRISILNYDACILEVFSENFLFELKREYNIFFDEKKSLIAEIESHEQDDESETSRLVGSINLIQRHSDRESEVSAIDTRISAEKLFYRLNLVYSKLIVLRTTENQLEIFNTICNIACEFQVGLMDLSNKIKNYQPSVRVILFSLGRYIESLEDNYKKFFRNRYPYTYFIRKLWRNSERLENVRFIKNINAGLSDNNEINSADQTRYALLCLMILKIETEHSNSKNTSILKKVIEFGLEHYPSQSRDRYNIIHNVNLFFQRHPDMTPPERLNNYINQL